MPPLNPFNRSCVALAISQTMLISASNAATINVISNADNNSSDGCTLRQAVASVNLASLQASCTLSSGTFGVDDTINLNLTPSSNTITLTSEAGGQLEIAQEKSLTINGATDANVVIDGGGENRVFYLRDTTLSINSLTITGGSVNGAGGGFYASSQSQLNLTNTTVSGNSASNGRGGGVAATYSASVTLNNSTVSGNSASFGGGIDAYASSVGLYNSTVSGNSTLVSGGGIQANSSSVSLSNSMVSGNSANYEGGGIAAASSSNVSLNNSIVSGNSTTISTAIGGEGGGLFASYSNFDFNNSTVSENRAAAGGGILVRDSSSINLNNSRVSENFAFFGGGLYAGPSSSANVSNSTVSSNSGTGITSARSSVSLTNSTVSSNSDTGVRVAYGSSASLSNSTVSDNRNGGGITSRGSSSVSLSNTLIAGNRSYLGREVFVNVGSTMLSKGGNLFGDSSKTRAQFFSNFTPSVNDITATSDGARPTALLSILSPLADNGGPTLTHALPTGSPALAAAKGANCPEDDQRGEPRESRDDSAFFVIKAANQKVVAFALGDDECDIGSFER